MERLDKRVEDLLLELQDMVNDAKAVPLSRDKKVVVSGDRIFDILDAIEEALPRELSEARDVLADHDQIIAEAKRNAQDVLRQAEERRKVMVSESEVVKASEAKAREIITNAKKESAEIHKAANSYVESIMKRTEEQLAAVSQDVKKAHQNFKSKMKQQ